MSGVSSEASTPFQCSKLNVREKVPSLGHAHSAVLQTVLAARATNSLVAGSRGGGGVEAKESGRSGENGSGCGSNSGTSGDDDSSLSTLPSTTPTTLPSATTLLAGLAPCLKEVLGQQKVETLEATFASVHGYYSSDALKRTKEILDANAKATGGGGSGGWGGGRRPFSRGGGGRSRGGNAAATAYALATATEAATAAAAAAAAVSALNDARSEEHTELQSRP